MYKVHDIKIEIEVECSVCHNIFTKSLSKEQFYIGTDTTGAGYMRDSFGKLETDFFKCGCGADGYIELPDDYVR